MYLQSPVSNYYELVRIPLMLSSNLHDLKMFLLIQIVRNLFLKLKINYSGTQLFRSHWDHYILAVILGGVLCQGKHH